MSNNTFELTAPWRIDDDAEMILTVHDESLLASRVHFLRFDVYPVHAPSNPGRHQGYWDIPMKSIKRATTKLAMKGDTIHVRTDLGLAEVRPKWRGDLPLAGTCILTVSILKRRIGPARPVATRSYKHLFMNGDGDLPLVRITLYVTRRCHANCDMCWRDFFVDKDEFDTPPTVIDAVVEAAPHLTSVLLHGDGEPLLNLCLPDILTRLKARMPVGGSVGMITNGMLLDQGTSRKLIDLGLDWFHVSMDGANESSLERIRRGCRFDTIVKNVEQAVEYARNNRSRSPDFAIQFTTREDNVHELPEMVRVAANMGVRHVVFGHLIDYRVGEFLVVDRSRLSAMYREAARVAEKLGVRLAGQPVRKHDPARCHFVEELFVHVSGEAAPCTFRTPGRPERPSISLGNVKDNPLHDIWNSREARELRKRLVSSDFRNACRHCPIIIWGGYVPFDSSSNPDGQE
jgi:radical SAM protein with 4Fe4S-binding SPASM domain